MQRYSSCAATVLDRHRIPRRLSLRAQCRDGLFDTCCITGVALAERQWPLQDQVVAVAKAEARIQSLCGPVCHAHVEHDLVRMLALGALQGIIEHLAADALSPCLGSQIEVFQVGVWGGLPGRETIGDL